MIVQQVSLTPEQATSILPPRILAALPIPGTCVFLSSEGDEAVGVMVVTPSSERTDRYKVIHLEVIGDEPIDVARGLFEKVESQCLAIGMKEMLCQITGDMEQVVQLAGVVGECDYLQVGVEGHLLLYYLQDLEDTMFVEKMGQMQQLLGAVKCYNELEPKQIAQFVEKLKSKKIIFDMPDLFFGRFYTVGNEIVGYMNLKEVAQGVLFMPEIYVEENDKTKFAVPAMIAMAILSTESLLGPETPIFMQTDSERMYRAIHNVFGQAEIDDNIFLFTKKIRD